MGTITELVVLYHVLSVSTDSTGGSRQDLDVTHTHIQKHTLLTSQHAAISGSQAGSQGAVTGLLGLSGTLSISSLIPSCLGWFRLLCGFIQLLQERAVKHYRLRAQCNSWGPTLKEKQKNHLKSFKPSSPPFLPFLLPPFSPTFCPIFLRKSF